MTSDNRTYYEILGVSEDASFEEIRAAFRERAREYHPDRNPDPDAVDRMTEVNEAYEVLRDDEQRTAYDRAHRYGSVSASDLTRASSVAITVVGTLACSAGWDTGAREDTQWSAMGVGGHDTPDGLWHAMYEAALESALESRNAQAAEAAAVDAARQAAGNVAARQARRHALFERASSPGEAHATDIAISIIGSLAGHMGRQLGELRSPDRPAPAAWKDAYDAAYSIGLAGFMQHTGTLTYRGGLNRAVSDEIVQAAMSAAFNALLPHMARSGGTQQRVAQQTVRRFAVRGAVSSVSGCLTIFFFTLMIMILITAICGTTAA